MFPVRLLATTGVGAAVASFTALAAFAAPATRQPAVSQAQNVSIVIQAGDRVAAPNFALAPGVPVRLTVVNFTREFHTFTIAGLRVSALIRPAVGQTPRTTIVAFTPRAGGVYTWHCVICPSGAHGRRHAMSGVVYVIIDPSAVP
jgi:hypothetical protein